MTKSSTTARDFPSMHVTPSGGHAGLAGLQGGLSIDLLLAVLLLAVTALMLLLVLAILTKSVAGG